MKEGHGGLRRGLYSGPYYSPQDPCPLGLLEMLTAAHVRSRRVLVDSRRAPQHYAPSSTLRVQLPKCKYPPKSIAAIPTTDFLYIPWTRHGALEPSGCH